jgi:hypothetical protein
MAQAVRDVQAKRRERDGVDARIAEAERDLAEASSFEGEYNARLAAIDREIGRVRPGWDPFGGQVKAAGGTPAESERLMAERAAVEAERERLMAERTATATDGAGFTLHHCPLRVGDVKRRLATLRAIRGNVEGQIRDLEGRLSPGEMCASGTPAPDFAEHTARVAAARTRLGIGA